jgi:ubiquinone/menaquinone biosynthesis C-methylase UbiE
LYNWEEMYQDTPPWDVGYPQPVFVKLVEEGEIKPGRVLDAGCGTGENALMLAKNGYSVTGIDVTKDAITKAQVKADKRNLKVDFIIGNVLKLDENIGTREFDTVIDSGLFHVMTDEERPIYVKQLHRVLKDGGKYFMMCFSDKEPGEWGPRRVSKLEIERSLMPWFKIEYIKDALFDTRVHRGKAKAYLVSAVKNK